MLHLLNVTASCDTLMLHQPPPENRLIDGLSSSSLSHLSCTRQCQNSLLNTCRVCHCVVVVVPAIISVETAAISVMGNIITQHFLRSWVRVHPVTHRRVIHPHLALAEAAATTLRLESEMKWVEMVYSVCVGGRKNVRCSFTRLLYRLLFLFCHSQQVDAM